MALLGLGMIVSGALAWLVAATRVILPYDEAFVGLTAAELARANDRLLPFLAHDRVSLAGTMISIGVLYAALAVYGIRLGETWARRTVAISTSVGFASFFLFLGFGYFDPLHTLLTVLLLLSFLLGLRDRAAAPPDRAPHDPGGARDRLAALPFVGMGAGLIFAGLVLSWLGVTMVFVPEDLVFMRTSRAELEAISPRLIPLIAHDRAGLGGALVSNGLAVLLTALWGFRRGARWLWWVLLGSGMPGFAAALSTHLAVGYVDLWHLAPAIAGAGLYVVALGMAYPYLCRPERLAGTRRREEIDAPRA